jgi:hypothetical protein
VLCLIFLGRRLRLLGPSVNSTSDAATILKLNRSDRAIVSLIYLVTEASAASPDRSLVTLIYAIHAIQVVKNI